MGTCAVARPSSRILLPLLLLAWGLLAWPILRAQAPVLIPGFSGEELDLYHIGWSPEGRWAGLISYAEPEVLYLVILDTIGDEVLLRSRQEDWKGSAGGFSEARIAALSTEVRGYGVETGRKTDIREAGFLTGGIRYQFVLTPASFASPGPYALDLRSGLKGRKTVYNSGERKVRRAELLGCLVSPFESRAMAIVRETGVAGEQDYRFVGAHLLIGFKEIRAGDQPQKEEQAPNLVSPVLNGQTEILELRLSAGVDPNQSDSRGFAVIVIAARLGHWGMVERLLVAGAMPDARDSDDRTALHYAAFSGQKAVVQALLANGADAGLRDAAGRTPGEIAVVSSIRALLE